MSIHFILFISDPVDFSLNYRGAIIISILIELIDEKPERREKFQNMIQSKSKLIYFNNIIIAVVNKCHWTVVSPSPSYRRSASID